jgi:hypothetical protein
VTGGSDARLVAEVLERFARSAARYPDVTVFASLETWDVVRSYDEKGRLEREDKVDRRTRKVIEATEYHYFLGRLSWTQTWAGGRAVREERWEYDAAGAVTRRRVFEVEWKDDVAVRLHEYVFDAENRLIDHLVHDIP